MSPPTEDKTQAVDWLREAAALNLEDPERRGSLLEFGTAGQVVMTGDMHGNHRNFEKLQRFCALERSPARKVILHELIHEEPAPGGHDLSIDMLLRAVSWKCAHPDNVFYIQSNHELSQLCRHEITKGGRSVIHDFDRGVRARFGAGGDAVLEAVDKFLRSLAIAGRTGNGVFLAHSLPDPLSVDHFDVSVFERDPAPSDVAPGGPVYSLVWGRFQTPEVVERFLAKVGARLAVVGHTPQDMGYGITGNMIVLASDHAHGSFLPIDLSHDYDIAALEENIRKFVAVS